MSIITKDGDTMKKNKFGLPFYIMFFTLTVLIEVYAFLEWRTDKISIIGTSIVLLIALYLLIDSVKHELDKKKEEYNLYLLEQNHQLEEMIERKMKNTKEELLRRQKNSVEILLKAQKSFTEAIIKDNNKK
ncbi:hypothetical protein [Anaerosporobacter faecicola]|uniref:hypothetical protein n=1 Tax=Anaerosporobacter faecicola TaxID=2718714 RepID=UPI00143C1FCF|nr:hypothetical protein [Anaerosporobacter faecicola]